MNKQELIDKLASLVGSIEDFKGISTFHDGKYAGLEHALELIQQLDELQNPVESKITDEQAWNKVAEAYPESAQSLRNTLDNAVFGKTGEHQKPVVPKFVAEWIEYAKKKGDSLAISFKPWNLYGVEYSKADRWIEDNQETFARAWIDGYEVEKEPVWVIKNAVGNYLTICSLWGKDGVNYSFECNPSHRLLFTDKSIADAAALLVNGTVEEVVEG